jgi:hypothetical protein
VAPVGYVFPGSIRALFISLVVAVLMIFTGFALIRIYLIPPFGFQYPDALLFWMGLPSLIYILVNLTSGMALNRYALVKSLID